MKKQIRKVKETDAAKIAAIYKYYVDNTAITFELDAPTTEEMANRIRKYTEKFPWIVLEVDGELVGYAYASQFRERVAYRFTVEISVYLSIDHCHNGYGRNLADELLLELKECGFYTVIAGITATNRISIRFFETLGFKLCAEFVNVGYKMGEWLSVVMLSKELQGEFTKTPNETTIP